jgi:hypothetical protein
MALNPAGLHGDPQGVFRNPVGSSAVQATTTRDVKSAIIANTTDFISLALCGPN